jgi:hypothetical protein
MIREKSNGGKLDMSVQLRSAIELKRENLDRTKGQTIHRPNVAREALTNTTYGSVERQRRTKLPNLRKMPFHEFLDTEWLLGLL